MLEEPPIRVGLVGTGFVARWRSQALERDPRAQLVAVAGRTWEQTCAFATPWQAAPCRDWQQLIERDDVDLVVISSLNHQRAAIAQAALEQHKHVLAEYPLALNPAQAQTLLDRAQQQQKLLHIAHIELLGGLHRAFLDYLPHLGGVSDVRYCTINPKHPAPRRWTYSLEQFGFPLIGALSRLHRLVSVFGQVESVTAQTRIWPGAESDYYRACLCKAQLRFTSGVFADVMYGKGDRFCEKEHLLEVRGVGGLLHLTPDGGQLRQGEQHEAIAVGSRRGLFAQDMQRVLDYLCQGHPLYLDPRQSLYTLTVAEAVRQAAAQERSVRLPVSLGDRNRFE
ncbi:glycosyl transferase family 2 [Phormidium willei BDU 130791]|nr:glycosyl transferase family 2 [Phormidium willei BDU 130791]